MPTERQRMAVDIVCVGFGPATGGFLTTLSRVMSAPGGLAALESRVLPGMPLQLLCLERSDDLAAGVSGVVTKARAIRSSFGEALLASVPMSHPVDRESLVYLQDPVGRSHRPRGLAALEHTLGSIAAAQRHHALELPHLPDFLSKEGGLLLSLGQFNRWVAQRLRAERNAHIVPGTPVAAPLIRGDWVTGVRLADRGVDAEGRPGEDFQPGRDIRAELTVLGDGAVGPVGAAIDREFGLPPGKRRGDWALGMKGVVELPTSSTLRPGDVLHTFGYPEPEIFGFLYVYADHAASLGIFLPSWMRTPLRASYRYLQHWMQHPYLWRQLKGGRLRSWGAKSLLESGRRGEPHLVGNGYARIGEGSGSTNVLAGSGVDEAWMSGVLLAEGVVELWRAGQPLDWASLHRSYVARRRESWLESDARIAEKARDGFRHGFVTGILGIGLTGVTRGKLNLSPRERSLRDRRESVASYCAGRISARELGELRATCRASGRRLHDALMDRLGWPSPSLDGRLLLSHGGAALNAGKVAAAPGYADPIRFLSAETCAQCVDQICVEICSGGALGPGLDSATPRFDPARCVHCAACVWSCAQRERMGNGRSNIEFRAAAGGLHSVEN